VRQRDDGGGLERRGFLQRAAWLGGAVLGSSIPATLRAAAAETASSTGSAMNDMTSEDVLKLLNLEPNATCGFVRQTYRASQQIAPGGLPAPFADGRNPHQRPS